MLVTPMNKKIGKYKPGDSFDLKEKIARLLIAAGKVREADTDISPRTGRPKRTYRRRDMAAES
jgi:hypothetical protein